jgi:hypothetical protein
MFSLSAALLVLALGSAFTHPLAGAFALQNGRSQMQAHMLAMQAGPSPLDRHLDIWLTRGASHVVNRYDIEMTKYLHVIAVSDDFATFLHVHPILGSDHHFRLDVDFPKAGLYHVYADGDPEGIGQQVFRFDLRVGPPVERRRDLAPTGATVTTGPYRVSLSATTLHAGSESRIAVHITEDGKPAKDLHPYLGALAHAVFIDATDLSYAHVHPMSMNGASGKAGGTAGASPMADMSGMAGMSGTSDMSSMSGMADMDMSATPLPDAQISSPDMMLHVVVRRAATYKLWLQFRGGGELHVAPFVLTVA